MAEGFLKSFDEKLEVYSAGTLPEKQVNPVAVKVMAEKNIDISSRNPENVKKYINEDFDYVITVCDEANEICPVFTGKVKKRLHKGFEDPAKVRGNNDFVLSEFRRIRDEIENEFKNFLRSLKY